MHGRPADLRGPHVVADNGRIHQELLALFADVFAGRYRVPLPTL